MISDKTRKTLWALAGNKCAMCRRDLVVSLKLDTEGLRHKNTVVGYECHIISGRLNGPRFQPGLSKEQLDSHDNLILLCGSDHKLIDDQPQVFTVPKIKQMRQQHEEWVSAQLQSSNDKKVVRVRRITGGTPEFLVRLYTGKSVFNVLCDAHGFDFDYDEPKSQHETELLSAFLQEAQDWGDLSGELEAGAQVEVRSRLSELLAELESAGFLVFGSREIRQIEGGHLPPSDWPIAILRVLRTSNPEIIKASLLEDPPLNTSDADQTD